MTLDDDQRLVIEKVLSICFPNLKKDKITIDSPDSRGNGFLSTISFVDITSESEVLNLVIKLSHQREDIRNFINPTAVFEREAYFYTTFYTAIREHQNEKSVISGGFSSIPRCYGTYIENKTEAIVLQNLKKLGYTLWDRQKSMDDCHITTVLEEYGQLHASSFALRKQKPQQFEDITSCLKKSDIFADIINQTGVLPTYYVRLEQVSQLLENKGRKEDAQKVKDFAKKIPEVLLNYGDPEDRYSVVLHGDCWSNNIMFFYEVSIVRIPILKNNTS